MSEKLEELVESQDFFEVAYVYRHAPEIDQVEIVRRFEELKAHIKGELQAWLREAGKELDSIEEDFVDIDWLRHDMLGTTQKPKQEGEK